MTKYLKKYLHFFFGNPFQQQATATIGDLSIIRDQTWLDSTVSSLSGPFLVSVFGPKSLIKIQAPVRGKLAGLTVGILCRQPTPSSFSHSHILYYIYVRHKNTILSDPFKKIFSLLCIKLSSERLHDKKNI